MISFLKNCDVSKRVRLVEYVWFITLWTLAFRGEEAESLPLFPAGVECLTFHSTLFRTCFLNKQTIQTTERLTLNSSFAVPISSIICSVLENLRNIFCNCRFSLQILHVTAQQL